MKRILVVGDIILDLYTTYKFKKICPDRDACAYSKIERKRFVGGAGNVAVNLAELVGPDGVVHLIGAASTETLRLIKFVSKGRVDMRDCIEIDDEIVKDRIMDHHGVCLMRLDSADKLPPSTNRLVSSRIAIALETYEFDAVVVSDYACGLFPEAFKVTSGHKRCFVDTKEKDLCILNRPYVLKLNTEEYVSIGLIDNRPPELCADNVIVTQGANGASLLTGQSIASSAYITGRVDFAGVPQETVVDVSGCGDTFLAALVYWSTLVTDGDIERAIQFANLCASSVVGTFGTTIVRYEDVAEMIPEEKRRMR